MILVCVPHVVLVLHLMFALDVVLDLEALLVNFQFVMEN